VLFTSVGIISVIISAIVGTTAGAIGGATTSGLFNYC
jgi:hypothetical protein